METEFLDLIKTFDKMAKRLSVLDEKILGFKDILEDLRENLDELVEMVKLEDIIDLATIGTQKISRLNEHYDAMMKAYQQLIELDSLEALTQKKWEMVLAELQETKELSQQVLSCVSSSETKGQSTLDPNVVECERGVYFIQHHELVWFSYETYSTLSLLETDYIVSHRNLIFAKTEDNITLIQNQTVIGELPIKCQTFVVNGYQIYYLTHHQLRTYHLLTHQDILLSDEVRSIKPLQKHLLIELDQGYQLVSI